MGRAQAIDLGLDPDLAESILRQLIMTSLASQERERVIVSKGLEAGERVLVSALEAPVDGMLVEVFEPEAGAAP